MKTIIDDLTYSWKIKKLLFPPKNAVRRFWSETPQGEKRGKEAKRSLGGAESFSRPAGDVRNGVLLSLKVEYYNNF